MLAADKGAVCLTMSALDTLPEDEFVKMMPGLLAMSAKRGWLVLIWGLLFCAHWLCYSGNRFAQVQESGNLAKSIVSNRCAFHRHSRWC